VFTGVAIAGLGGRLVFGAKADDAYSRYNSATDISSVTASRQDVENATNSANISFGISVTAAGLAALSWILDSKSAEPTVPKEQTTIVSTIPPPDTVVITIQSRVLDKKDTSFAAPTPSPEVEAPKKFDGTLAYPFPPSQDHLATIIKWEKKHGDLSLDLDDLIEKNYAALWANYSMDREGSGNTDLERKLSRQSKKYLAVKDSVNRRMTNYRNRLLATPFYYEESVNLGSYVVARNGYFSFNIGGANVVKSTALSSVDDPWYKNPTPAGSEYAHLAVLQDDAGRCHLFSDFYLRTGKNLSRVYISERQALRLEYKDARFVLVFKLTGATRELHSEEVDITAYGVTFHYYFNAPAKPIVSLVAAMLLDTSGKVIYRW
jgi:hypothetical protein